MLIRALGAEFIRRKLRTITIIVGVLLFVLLALATWLTTLNSWWGIALVLVIVLACVAAFIVIGTRVLLAVLSPRVSKQQSADVKRFVDKLERLADLKHLSPPMIFLQFLRDTVRPRDVTFIESVTGDSTSLRSDYLALKKHFE